MASTVAVLGGGVAGMSAAHELAERGFDVSVFETGGLPGGKARSMPFEGTGLAGRRDFPAEHGFRFFPTQSSAPAPFRAYRCRQASDRD